MYVTIHILYIIIVVFTSKFILTTWSLLKAMPLFLRTPFNFLALVFPAWDWEMKDGGEKKSYGCSLKESGFKSETKVFDLLIIRIKDYVHFPFTLYLPPSNRIRFWEFVFDKKNGEVFIFESKEKVSLNEQVDNKVIENNTKACLNSSVFLVVGMLVMCIYASLFGCKIIR